MLNLEEASAFLPLRRRRPGSAPRAAGLSWVVAAPHRLLRFSYFLSLGEVA